MSGLEVVGVVFAVLPLLISAIENHKKGLNPLTTLLYPGKYRKELLTLGRKLRVQRDLYQASLGSLLSPAISRERLAVLIKNPTGPAWRTPATAAKLKLQLESTHFGCLIVIDDIASAFTQFQELLCSPKFKFSFQRERRKELLESIESDNKSLAAFLVHYQPRNLSARYYGHVTAQEVSEDGSEVGYDGDRIAEYKKDKTLGELHLKRLKRVRSKASDLHRALESSFNCKSGLSHIVNLQLEQVTADREAELNFRLLFVLSSMSYNGDIPAHWKWQEVQMHEVLSPESHVKRVEDVCSAIAHLASSQKEQQGSQDLPPEYVKSPQGSAQFLLGGVQEPLMTQEKHQPSIRLSKILGRPKQPSSDMAASWYRYHRMKVAVVLAHALLQLHGSPWLSSTWSCSDIQLIATSNGRPSSADWQPFISKTFDSSSEIGSASDSSRARGPHIRNHDLYSLAIVLLELAFNAPLQEKRTDQDSEGTEHYQDAYINYNTACRLTKLDLICEMGPEFAKVVRYCLWGFPHLETHDLNSEEFHGVVCANIIGPLENDLKLRAPNDWQ
ncbi:MAG: hypothetical protein Q9187_003377 [Circinaria calcarea]